MIRPTSRQLVLALLASAASIAAVAQSEIERLKELKDRERSSLKTLKKFQILTELDYRNLSMKYVRSLRPV